MMYQ